MTPNAELLVYLAQTAYEKRQAEEAAREAEEAARRAAEEAQIERETRAEYARRFSVALSRVFDLEVTIEPEELTYFPRTRPGAAGRPRCRLKLEQVPFHLRLAALDYTGTERDPDAPDDRLYVVDWNNRQYDINSAADLGWAARHLD